MKFHLQALYRNVIAGARLALFMPVRAYDYRVSALDYALLLAFNFAMWVAAAAIRTGLAGEFDSAALPIYLAGVPLVLAAALAVALIYGAREQLLLVATALTASDPLFELAALALEASCWVDDATARDADPRDRDLFADENPVPAVRELLDAGKLASTPTTRLV